MRRSRIILISIIMIIFMFISLSLEALPVQASAILQEPAPKLSVNEMIPESFYEVYDFLLKAAASEIRDQEPLENQDQSPLLKWALKSLQKLIALLSVSLLIAWLSPAILTKPLTVMKEKTGKSIGIGAMVFFLIPIALIVFAGVVALLVFLCSLVKFNYLAGTILILGLGILLILITGYVFLLGFLSKAIIGLWLGQQFFKTIKKDLGEKTVLCMLAGGIFVAILVKIPWVGRAFSFFIDLIGIGAFWLSLKRIKKKNK
jgi:hypothetical protein